MNYLLTDRNDDMTLKDEGNGLVTFGGTLMVI